ncbi:TIGR03620 family F420-dependent LLM class oxidoreductase [Trujillonella endophytica]|uniref:Probable F420-dependent oxidoreductase, MSMEG_4141 family n=1 Tax=Trujillonella endophytica TaxID=673521 RepID=A0A1H8SE44_9ACTN|nr:TIGR03620 family F420-dependent LLM class oxidoreductase [Trujillella endophytica]SEO77319.1 probable F420-dependent oxidoreductase, MSMEG_4141 family [Trujillella endophytica]
MDLGALGAWLPPSMNGSTPTALAATLEEQGYPTVWIAGGISPGIFDVIEEVLAGTERITVAIGIVNVWMETPESVTAGWHRCEERWPGRLLVGLGISHGPIIDAFTEQTYRRPLATMREYLDALDAQTDPLPPQRRVLGALGPKMLALAAERTAGTHPYHVTVTNTAAARAGVGTGPLVAPELPVVLTTDVAEGRDQARSQLTHYLQLPNYANNWFRAGFTESDLADGGSDRLIDALVAIGDVDAIAARVREHHDAGADHVCLQVLGPQPNDAAVYAELAGLIR